MRFAVSAVASGTDPAAIRTASPVKPSSPIHRDMPKRRSVCVGTRTQAPDDR